MTGKGSRGGRDGRAGAPVGVLRGAGQSEGEATGPGAPAREPALRRAMERAALELSGEVGFAGMTVAGLVERSGSNRERFYRAYGDKAGCYAAAHAAGMDELADGLLVACARESRWADGVRAALAWLAELVETEPRVIKGLLGGAGAAGARAEAKREEVFARLARALERARAEGGYAGDPPARAAPFLLHGITTLLLRALDRPEGEAPGAWAEGALYIAVDLYLGPEAAREQVRLLAGRGG